MLFPTYLRAVLLSASTARAVSLRTLQNYESQGDVQSPGWTKISDDINFHMRIGIKPKNYELGHDHLMRISDPTSSDFGAHWSAQEVHDFFSPSSETVSMIEDWLLSSGISRSRFRIPASRAHVTFHASSKEVESLLGAQHVVWRHDGTGELSITSDSYHIPSNIESHIDFVTPRVDLDRDPAFADFVNDGRPRRRSSQKRKFEVRQTTYDFPCWQAVTPQCIKELYQVPNATSSIKGNEMGIYETGDAYAQSDLNAFFTSYAPNIPNNTAPILQSIDGGVAPVPESEVGSESILDLDIAYPLIYPQKIKLYQTLPTDLVQNSSLGINIFEPFLDALDAEYCDSSNRTIPGYNGTAQCGIYKPANVISFSYELAEAYFTPAYAKRQCHEFLKLGLMGTTLVFSSGDNGTLSRSGVYGCLDGGAQNPSFVSTCPYVTSVGATQIEPEANVTAPEVAVNPLNDPFSFLYFAYFSSGGGFSNVFPRPAYQDGAVTSYLEANADTLPASSTYNQNGRAFPDVAANGYNIVNTLNGGLNLEEGTSASAPIFASIVNRLNEERLAIGKGPVGFLNPTLYANPSMFNDITSGYNLGCNASKAFNASVGWDPVTGLGTPNYPKMLKVFLALP
ncbi:subtilisin-like protein [Xylariaceae sp. FL0255]|nr:subtilisin-like protein [Xylariaceae sp. FL0255]